MPDPEVFILTDGDGGDGDGDDNEEVEEEGLVVALVVVIKGGDDSIMDWEGDCTDAGDGEGDGDGDANPNFFILSSSISFLRITSD